MQHSKRGGWVLAGGVLLASLWVGGPVSAADAPVTLRLATVSGEDGQIAELIAGFAEAVEAASEGSVVIEPVWRANGDNPEGGDDQVLVGRVTSGDLEMVLASSRGFDNSGTTALKALQTPFLITDDALATAIATGEVGARTLEALDDAGMVGLALWPDGLRHLMTFTPHPEPFLTPSDLDGTRIRSVVSAVAWDLLQAYGAQVSQMNDFQETDYDGEEQELRDRGEVGKAATGNVTLFPRFQVLAVDAATFSRLTAAQQEALRTAALGMRDAGIAAMVPEAEAAAAFCGAGGRIVDAAAEGVQAFLDGAAPVVAALEGDPETAGLVEAIRALKAETSPAPGAAACDPAPLPSPDTPVAAWTPALPPDGVYRTEMTYESLLEAGASTGYARDNAGTWTWTIIDGDSTISWSQRPSERCESTTELIDNAVRITFPGDLCVAAVADLQWETVDGGIRFELIAISPAGYLANEGAWYAQEWARIE